MIVEENVMTRKERRQALQPVKAMPQPECMIWTHTGVWLETNGHDGRRRASYCGNISFVSAEEFCRKHGLQLLTFQSKGQG